MLSVLTNFVTHGLFTEAASSLRDGLNWEQALLDHSPLRCSPGPYPCSRGGRTRFQFFCWPQNKLPETWDLINCVHRNTRTHVSLVGSARQSIPRLVYSYELQSGTQGELSSSALPAEPEELLANEQAETCTRRVLELPHVRGGGGCVIGRDP